MVQYSATLPDIYQNFAGKGLTSSLFKNNIFSYPDGVEGVSGSEHASLGSSVTLADFCPFVQVWILLWCKCYL